MLLDEFKEDEIKRKEILSQLNELVFHCNFDFKPPNYLQSTQI